MNVLICNGSGPFAECTWDNSGLFLLDRVFDMSAHQTRASSDTSTFSAVISETACLHYNESDCDPVTIVSRHSIH